MRISLLAVLVFFASAASAVASPTAHMSIIGGYAEPFVESPWQVALVDGNAPVHVKGAYCGGTLVSPQAVVTAAHCVSRRRPHNLVVVSGTASLSASGTRSRVSRVIRNLNYSARNGVRDIAVLRLASPASGVPLALGMDPNAWQPHSPIKLSGWGITRTRGRSMMTDLRAITSLVRPDADCEDRYGEYYDSRYHICAGRVGRDTCQGDSGGPMVSYVTGVPQLIGVTSWGEGCGTGAGVYSWIGGEEAFLRRYAPEATFTHGVLPEQTSEHDECYESPDCY